VATNGALRQKSWWRDLAEYVDHCVFGIDGLADTHHLYRRGTDFDTVLANAKAYIGGGGRAEWAYLIFKHNQHQVDEAHRLAREIGFDTFSAKATSRFYNDGRKEASSPVRSASGQVEYLLEATDDARLANTGLDRLDEMLLGDPVRFEDYINTTKIDCKAITRKKLYISGEGHAFPCCWLGNIYAIDRSWQETEMGAAVVEAGGLDLLDAKRYPIEDILTGDFFTKVVPAGWKEGESRLKICSKMCGEVDMNLAQYVDYTPEAELAD
jgi:sulfatase maturation enzyme AslB (radical SAM superfamily)